MLFEYNNEFELCSGIEIDFFLFTKNILFIYFQAMRNANELY